MLISNRNEVFEEIIGQVSAINLLDAAIQKQRVAPSYLFKGPEGVGRKLTAIRFLEGLIKNAEQPKSDIRKRLETHNHPDLLLIEPTYMHQGNLITQTNAAIENLNFRTLPQVRLEQIKIVKRFLGKKPVETKRGMVIIEDVHNMNESAANALLKTLEEPNQGIFILISSRPESLLSTIRSRCQEITFNRLNKKEVNEVLDRKMNNTIDISNIVQQKEFVNLANGSPGLMLKNLEIWETIPDELWTDLKSLPNNNPIEALSLAKKLTEKLDSNEQIWLIGWLQQYLWNKTTDSKIIRQLETLRKQIKAFVSPRLAWEVTLLKLQEDL
ncbi:DNA polymerase III subunit delta' [Prochlorococcus sp. MIT 1223]|uniref:DNA polymerase III subunit delta' n=1 Tax=Prochlorococcus sp. MIT 1223 TaxID=3096217 RepID=UPI002A7613F1|nr:DNA polymerase III subunit delta' [Prochlorococcus sp. MIT 1223]